MVSNWTGSHSNGFPQATRRIILRRHPTCQACHARPSAVADHITPRAEGGTDDPANGQGLCNPCHDIKTLTEQQRGRDRARERNPRQRPSTPHPAFR